MALVEHVRGTRPPVLVALIALFIVLLLVAVVAAEKRKINGSTVTIAIGALVGLLVWPTGLAEATRLDVSMATFNRELFYYALLPPVIFEAGFSLRKRPFFANIGTILLFAVLGTLATVVVIGQPLYAMGAAGLFRDGASGADALDFRTPLDSYLFAACVSATDPVATLSIMGAMGVEEQLYALVFGESVLNDAVAIVLVGILESLGDAGFRHPARFLVGIGYFVAISLGSVATAAIVSAASALLLKWMHAELAHHASFEVGLIFLFGYISYATAEALGCSGLLAIFLSGVLQSHYHVYSLSDDGRKATAIALKSIAHLLETGARAAPPARRPRAARAPPASAVPRRAAPPGRHAHP
jgi:sodium/hydrogen exchanger 8